MILGYLKLGGLIVAGAAVVALLVIVNGWRKDAERVPVLEQQVAQAQSQLEAERANTRKVQEVSSGYQSELSDLRAARARQPARAVRLCGDTNVSTGSTGAAAEPGSDAASPGAGGIPQAPGRDIGPELYALADRADELSAQARALQNYARVCSP